MATTLMLIMIGLLLLGFPMMIPLESFLIPRVFGRAG